MASTLKVENFFDTVIASTFVNSSGDVSVQLGQAPTNTKGFIIFSPDNANLREIAYYDSTSGTTINIKGINRINPKEHSQGETARINDVSEFFNYLSGNTSHAFYIEKLSSTLINVFGGSAIINGTVYSLNDTQFSIPLDGTYYVGLNVNSGTIDMQPSVVSYIIPRATIIKVGSNLNVTYTKYDTTVMYGVFDGVIPPALIASINDKLDKVSGLRTSMTPKAFMVTDASGNEGTITGTTGQVVGFDGTNNPIAINISSSTLSNSYTAGETIASGNAVYIASDGLVYKAGTVTTFLGFAQSTVSASQSVVVDTNGITATQSGLSIGTKYYLVTSTPSGNTWANKTAITTSRYNLTASTVGNKIYCIGGSINLTQYLQTNEEYDPTSNTWASKANMTTGRQWCSSAAVNNKIYVIGGYSTGAVTSNINEEYDPASNTWASKTNMTTARRALTCSVVNNKIYAIGGSNGSVLQTNEEYDPTSNTWASKTNMTTARQDPLSQSFNNKIYCIGGYQSGYLTTNEEYDPIANTWASKTSMGTARSGAFSVISSGIVYVFGGETTGITRLVTSEAYAILANTWSSKASMTNARSVGGSGLVNGKAYIIGGYNGANGLGFNEEYTIPYNISSGTISIIANSTKVGVATSATSLLIQTNF